MEQKIYLTDGKTIITGEKPKHSQENNRDFLEATVKERNENGNYEVIHERVEVSIPKTSVLYVVKNEEEKKAKK